MRVSYNDAWDFHVEPEGGMTYLVYVTRPMQDTPWHYSTQVKAKNIVEAMRKARKEIPSKFSTWHR